MRHLLPWKIRIVEQQGVALLAVLLKTDRQHVFAFRILLVAGVARLREISEAFFAQPLILTDESVNQIA